MSLPVVLLESVSRTFEGTPPVHALKNADLSIGEGEYLSIMGPSGSGKSTLLNILGLLDEPTGGSYTLDGVDVRAAADSERTALRGRKIGFVFQALLGIPWQQIDRVALRAKEESL